MCPSLGLGTISVSFLTASSRGRRNLDGPRSLVRDIAFVSKTVFYCDCSGCISCPLFVDSPLGLRTVTFKGIL